MLRTSKQHLNPLLLNRSRQLMMNRYLIKFFNAEFSEEKKQTEEIKHVGKSKLKR